MKKTYAKIYKCHRTNMGEDTCTICYADSTEDLHKQISSIKRTKDCDYVYVKKQGGFDYIKIS